MLNGCWVDAPLLACPPGPVPETAAHTTAVPSQTNGHEERPFVPAQGTGQGDPNRTPPRRPWLTRRQRWTSSPVLS